MAQRHLPRLSSIRPGTANKYTLFSSAQALLHLPWLFLLVFIAAEAVLYLAGTPAGLVLHAVLLLGLTACAALVRQAALRSLALVLALLPLIRIVTLAMPLGRFPQLAWYPLTIAPILLAAIVAIRQLKLSRRALGLQRGQLPVQLLLVGGGLSLGVLAAQLLAPAGPADFSLGTLLLTALIALLFAGFGEELIFRGLLQAVAGPIFRAGAPLYVALLCALLQLGSGSLTTTLFTFGTALLFGYLARWSGSILGVSLAHGLANITALLIVPYITAHPSPTLSTLLLALVAVSSVMLVMAPTLIWSAAIGRGANPTPAITRPSLRALRINANLRYTELAQQTGLSVRVLAELEHGLRPLLPEQACLLAAVLGAPSTVSSIG